MLPTLTISKNNIHERLVQEDAIFSKRSLHDEAIIKIFGNWHSVGNTHADAEASLKFPLRRQN